MSIKFNYTDCLTFQRHVCEIKTVSFYYLKAYALVLNHLSLTNELNLATKLPYYGSMCGGHRLYNTKKSAILIKITKNTASDAR